MGKEKKPFGSQERGKKSGNNSIRKEQSGNQSHYGYAQHQRPTYNRPPDKKAPS
jgi:hypothetical protein